MGASRRWKRKQSKNVSQDQNSCGASIHRELGSVTLVINNDFDGVAVGWQCKQCEAHGSILLPTESEPEDMPPAFASFFQTHETCDREPAAELPEEVANAFDVLRGVFETGLLDAGQCDPTGLILGTKIGVHCPPFRDDFEKQLTLSMFRATCRDLLSKSPFSQGVAIGFEGWKGSDPAIRASLDPRRTECAGFFALCGRGAFSREYEIVRESGRPGIGPGSLREIGPELGQLCSAPTFLTCAARPAFRAGESQLVS